MFKEFKAFIAKGNVMDLAVAVIIGAAFGKIVTALTKDLIMPIVGLLFGGLDFSSKYIVLKGHVEPGMTLAQAQKAGANVLAYGDFISVVLNFLILAFIIFLMVRYTKKIMEEVERKEEEAPPPPPGPSEIDLLTEIRDALKK